MKIARKYLPPISLLLISTLGVAYAATNLFTQTFSAIPAVSGITVNCTSLTSNVASAATGSSGVVFFDCSGTSPLGTTPAFSTSTPGGTLQITPTFTLPAPYTGIFLALDGSLSSDCTLAGGASLTSGNAITSGAHSARYEYCVPYQNAPSTGLPTFSVTWTTPTTPFTQTIPAISGTAALTSNCATLTAFEAGIFPTSQVTSVATGSTGILSFDCSGASSFGTSPAFTVTAPGATVSFTPHFTLPASYAAVGIFQPSNGNQPCGPSVNVSQLLTNGTPFTFTGSASYAYCVGFQNVPTSGLPTFGVTWST